MISPDQAEVASLALLSGLDPKKMAAAFNEPQKFFDHLSLPELTRLQETCQRFAIVQNLMIAAMDQYKSYAKGLLEGLAVTREPATVED